MKRFVSLMLTIVLLLTMTAPAMAAFTHGAIITEVRLMEAGRKLSNDLITQAIIDLSNMENHGTVSATVYASVYENQTVNNYTDILRQPPADGTIKLTHFIFELTNQYRLQDTDLMLSVSPDRRTVRTYVYGQYKDQAMYSVLTGIPDCLNNEPYSRPPSGGESSGSKSSGGSWIEPYSPENIGTDPIESFQVTTFAINEKTYTVTHSTTAADEEESIVPIIKTMDVAPYIKEDRTYVPVRYLAYSLGVAEEGVTWDGDARRVGISKDDTDIALIIGSPVMQVNKSPVRMDVSPEITNDRTFLPARWVAEALGAEVEWDDTTKQAIIKMPIEEEPGD
jgi:hypothetical protein